VGDLELRRGIDAEVAERQRIERLLLRLHDLGQLDVARLVQAQIRRDHGGQVDLDGLETCVDFTRDARGGARELDLRGERRLRTVPQRSQHLTGLVVVVVDALLAEQHDLRLLALDELQEHARSGERLERRVRLHEDRPIGAHRKAGAQLLLGVGGTDARNDHFRGAAFLFDAQRLLEGDLVEGVDAHLDAIGHDAAAVRFDAHAHVVVDDPFETYEDLAHERLRWGSSCKGRTLYGKRPDDGGLGLTAGAGATAC